MLLSVRNLAIVLLLCANATSSWCAPQSAQLTAEKISSEQQEHASPFAASIASVKPPTTTSFGTPTRIVRNIWSDQKTIWSNPFHLQAHDAAWLVPLGLMTGALIAGDSKVMHELPEEPRQVKRSRDFGNYGAAAMVGTAGTFYLWGGLTKNEHIRETGFLAGEALVDGTIVAESFKLVFQRPRPEADDGRGRFWQGGASFPSEHAMAAWSVATVVANEYPGMMTRMLVYGGASAISLSRVTAREHFPSDVFIGSTMGWMVGRQVYRSHHDKDLGGATWGTFTGPKPVTLRAPAELGSPYVALDSWTYVALDRLAALGYVPSAFAGLRPWTRMECARLIDSAGELLAGTENRNSNAYQLYAVLRAEFPTELSRLHGSETAELRLNEIYTRYTKIADTPLADGYHFGQTLVNDYGRPYGQGSNLVSGASGWASAGSVAFYVRAEYQHAAALPAYTASVQQLIGSVDGTPPQLPFHTTAIDQVRFLDAYAAWNFKSIQLSVGRQSLEWGPNRSGPLMFSTNAGPMNMVRVTKTSPWKLPGFLGRLGPIRWDVFWGLMEGHHFPADPAIQGQKISFKPTPNLELGFSRTVVFRPVTARGFWRAFSSVGDGLATGPGTAQDVGDRRGGFDFSYRVPGLRQWLVFYNDALTDDDPSPLSAPHRSMMSPGIYLPQIPKIPKLDLRVEMPFSDTPNVVDRGGNFFYINGAFKDSYTNGGNLLGSWVGRQGRGLQVQSTYWFSPRDTLEVGYREASVDKEFIPSGGHIRDFSARATFSLASGVDLSTLVQHELWNFPVLSSHARADTTASVQLTYRPTWGKLLTLRQP